MVIHQPMDSCPMHMSLAVLVQSCTCCTAVAPLLSIKQVPHRISGHMSTAYTVSCAATVHIQHKQMPVHMIIQTLRTGMPGTAALAGWERCERTELIYTRLQQWRAAVHAALRVIAITVALNTVATLQQPIMGMAPSSPCPGTANTHPQHPAAHAYCMYKMHSKHVVANHLFEDVKYYGNTTTTVADLTEA